MLKTILEYTLHALLGALTGLLVFGTLTIYLGV